MRILFINCQSFKTAYGLSDTIEKYDIDVLCLNETFEYDKNHVFYKDWKIYSSPRPNQTRGGAAICVKPNINYVSQQIFNEQMQTIEMTCVNISFKDQQILNIWCPYVPPEKPKLMEELCNHINRKMSENTILVGDLNAKSYQWNNGNENSHGRLLEDCMTQNQLICLNDGQATRRNSNSIIDLALTTQTTYKKSLECTTLTHENVKSDHIGIYVKLHSCINDSKREDEVPKWNIHKCDLELWNQTTKDQFSNVQLNDDQNLEHMYQQFEDNFLNCMEITVPKISKSSKKFNRPCWWNPEVGEKKHNLNKSQRTFKLRSSPTNLSSLIKAEEEYIKAKEDALEKWSENICANINNARNIKDKWMEFRKFTNRKSNNTILPFIQPDNTVIFEENSKAIELEKTFFKGKHLNINHFDEHFYDEMMGEYITMTLSDDEGEDDYYNKEISMDELEGAVSRLKIESAPGPDNIFSKLLINADKTVLDFLLQIFNKSWKEGYLPKQWKKANVKFLKKNR